MSEENFALVTEKFIVGTAVNNIKLALILEVKPHSFDLKIIADHLFGEKPSFVCKNPECEIFNYYVQFGFKNVKIDQCPKCHSKITVIPASEKEGY